ncbi:MAG: ABC transporter permease [Candidatus Melainabacteria bacterium]|nr:ABC transporter permease [Candidatus Melainabacteria bacterium]
MLNDLQNRITVAKVGDYKFIRHRYMHRLLFGLLLFAIWQGAVNLELYPRYLLPSPGDILQTMIYGFIEADYGLAILESLRRVIFGYLLAISVGLFAGLAIARYHFLDTTVGASLTALQSIPSVAWVPLALLWFGISEAAVLFIVILEAFIPCALGVRSGVMNIPREIIRAGQTLGAKHLDLYIRVILPAIVPQLITSLKLSWAFAWRALIAGELFVSGLGIGQSLELGRSLADMAQVISMIVIIAILGFVSDNLLFTKLEKSLREKWGLN